jgi:hypothetical protein
MSATSQPQWPDKGRLVNRRLLRPAEATPGNSVTAAMTSAVVSKVSQRASGTQEFEIS